MLIPGISFAVSVAPTVTPVQFSTASVPAASLNKAGPVFVGTITAANALQSGDTLTLTLFGGAKFDAITWASEVAKGTFIADNINANGTVSGCSLSAGLTTLSCQVGVSTAGVATTINISTAALYDLDLVTGNVTLGIETTRTSLGVTSVIHTVSATDLANSVLINVNPTIQKGTTIFAGAGKVATVTELFKSFGTGGGRLLTTATTGSASTTGDAAQAGATGFFVLRLTGLPAAATKVMIGAGGTVAASDANANVVAASNGGDFWLDGAGSGFARLAGTSNLPTLAGLVITMDGVTAITAGVPKLEINYLTGNGDQFSSHVILPASNLTTITRNGSDIILSLISAGTRLKITNEDSIGTSAGLMAIIATTIAGVTIADTGLAVNAMPSAVAPGKTVSIQGADLLAAFPAAAKINFVIESNDVSATNTIVVPTTGANINTIRTGAGSAM